MRSLLRRALEGRHNALAQDPARRALARELTSETDPELDTWTEHLGAART